MTAPDAGARHWRVDPDHPDPAVLGEAAAWLRDGRLVIFPTETFYGLAADPRSARGIAAIFEAKGRGSHAALPLVAADRAAVSALAPLSPRAERLADVFWPGPLSLIVEAPGWVAAGVHGGTGTLAVRVPDHPVARALAAAAGGLVTATSANLSGHPPASTVDTLDSIAADPSILILDGGPTPGGRPSTIVDARVEPIVLVREGAVPWSRVQSVARR